MVSKTITPQDLQNLEQKIKLDISKEQTELRHDDRSKMQTYYNMVDDLDKKLPLTNQKLETMNDKIDNMGGDIKEMREEIRNMIDKLEGKFAGKWTENLLIFIGSAVGIAIIGAIMSLIIIK